MPQPVGPAPGGGTAHGTSPSDSQSGLLLHRENAAQKVEGAALLTMPGRGRIAAGQGFQLSFVLTRTTNPTPGQQRRFVRKWGGGRCSRVPCNHTHPGLYQAWPGAGLLGPLGQDGQKERAWVSLSFGNCKPLAAGEGDKPVGPHAATLKHPAFATSWVGHWIIPCLSFPIHTMGILGSTCDLLGGLAD